MPGPKRPPAKPPEHSAIAPVVAPESASPPAKLSPVERRAALHAALARQFGVRISLEQGQTHYDVATVDGVHVCKLSDSLGLGDDSHPPREGERSEIEAQADVAEKTIAKALGKV